MSADPRTLKAPTRQGVFTHLLTAGITILVIGLLIPFIVAEPGGQAVSLDNGQAVLPQPAGGVGQSPAVPGTTGQTGSTTTPGTTGTAGTTTGTTGTGTTGGTGTSGTTGGTAPRPAAPSGTSPAPAPAAPAPAGPAAAPTTPAGPSANPADPAAPAAPTGPLTASDVGVTPESIRVGVLIPDEIELDGGGSSGESTGDIQQQWQVAIDAANAAGGINGRQVEAVYQGFDALDADSMRAACIALTEQQEVFTVLNANGFYGDPILCVTEQHGVPFIGQAGEGRDFYERSNGLYFSTTPNKDRVLLNAMQRMYDDGYFEGRTVGIVEQEGIDKIPVDRSMVPILNQLGVDIAYRATFSEDFAAAQSQMPVHISQMRSAGVDTVLLPVGLAIAGLFVSQAETQGYVPQYWTSDFASGTTDLYTILMSGAFDGALGYTALRTGEARAGYEEAALDRACREQYEAGGGASIDPTTTEYYFMVNACGITDLLVRAGTAAGPELTRTGLSQALQGLGEVAIPYSGTSSFGAGKFDAPDVVRLVQWSSGCRCWTPASDFVRTTY